MAITFTRAWEDDRLDVEALDPRPGSRLVVVGAAGDTAMAMAASGAEVLAVDRNADQLRLVALKWAACRSVPGDQLHAWFEVGRDPAGGSSYRASVRGALDPVDAAWWDRNIGLFERGLHASTGVGRSFARAGWLARRLVPGLASTLESMTDPVEQQGYWRTRVQPRLFGRLTHVLAARTPILASLAPDPHELARMRATGWSRGLVGRIDAVVGRVLIRDHPWWRPALTGRPADPAHGAAWLDPDRIAALAGGAGRLAVEHGDLATVLEARPPGSVDAISVSNVPDWLAHDEADRLAAAVAKALRPGGRVLVRRVVTPDPGLDPFARDDLEPDAARTSWVDADRTALYERVDLLRRA